MGGRDVLDRVSLDLKKHLLSNLSRLLEVEPALAGRGDHGLEADTRFLKLIVVVDRASGRRHEHSANRANPQIGPTDADCGLDQLIGRTLAPSRVARNAIELVREALDASSSLLRSPDLQIGLDIVFRAHGEFILTRSEVAG